MKHIFLLASTAILAACSMDGGTVESASSEPVASAPETAKSDVNAELSQFFEDYDKEELSFSPIGKAFRGIRDEDYGKWGDFSDAADVAP
jgi:hypothetical protein